MSSTIPAFWMISNRNRILDGFGHLRAEPSFWTSTGGILDRLTTWTEVSKGDFESSLRRAVEAFPLILDPALHENRKHILIYIHGFNIGWEDAIHQYQKVCRHLIEGNDGIGLCILFDWPSVDLVTGYGLDLLLSLASAPDLAGLLDELHDARCAAHAAALSDPHEVCRAKVSILAHSMGNFLLQKAMQQVWTVRGRPTRTMLVDQCVMLAADVDNDLFRNDPGHEQSDGVAMANLTYRITALYTPRDAVLGASQGLHFGKRRLGRSGLDFTHGTPDNVWHMDCSDLFPPQTIDIHEGYFDNEAVFARIRVTLRGVDRTLV